MTPTRFCTRGCSSHRHPEVSFVFAEPVPVPGAERMLLDYFESAVARGVQFRPGQKVDIGGCLLGLFDRGDGSLGVRDIGPDAEFAEPESAHRSVMRTWCRQEVARSFGFEPLFPATDATAMICTELVNSGHAILMKRHEPVKVNPRDSGWFVGCTNKAHDHNAADALGLAYVMQIVEKFPWLDPFFALPIRTDLVVEMEDRPKLAVLWHGDQEDPIAPLEGSYVAVALS